ncbi:sensor histidine kinase [Paenibacillus sanguinis]|uniref:sensor histidine kinase n=1 Tax=Paenibacillus sanguinis TaxID=225906 RepID=UPI0003777491|nr:HAMP domain-containing sensor histidine kinase [Paenibacillus sanguinis]
MKSVLKIIGKILLLMIIPLVVYLLSLRMFGELFSLLRKTSPLVGNTNEEFMRHAAVFLSAVLVASLFFIFVLQPVIYVIHWIQLLAKGNFHEPDIRYHCGKLLLSRWSRFLYKELLGQMQSLSNKLKQSEADRAALEKNRQEWLAGITHDLKTPLTYIQGYASMISSQEYKWTDEEMINFGRKIEEKSRHIKDLIDDLNLSFQSKDGKIFVHKTEVEIVSFIRNCVLDIANSQQFSDYVFSFESNIDSLPLAIDTTLIQRALQNILINGIIHNPPETEIIVSVERQQKTFLIRIEDNGHGMDEETKRKLFETYYRGTPTDRPTEGSGLGMSIAKKIIELHHGSIRVDSMLGEGSSIFIELPISFI